MSVVIERISDNEVKLTIEVSKEDFSEALDVAFEKVVKDIKVDGYRPGKLPKKNFITRFGYEPLYEEAVNYAINKTYGAALEKEDVKVVNYPKIDLDFSKVSHDAGFTYTATVDVMPIVHLGSYTEIEVETLSKEVTDEEIEAEIKRALEKGVENVIKDTPAEFGDTTIIDFEGFIDGTPFEGGKGENYALELGSHSFIPGFEEQLVGVLAEEEKDVNVTFPENYHAELASKPATFKVKVHEVKKKVYPELTNEFVEDLEIADVKTVAQYRAYVKEDLEHNKLHTYEEHLTNALIDKVCENSHVDIPECMITEYSENMKKNAEKQAEQYKIPFEVYLQYMGYTKESFDEEIKKNVIKNLTADMVINEIALKENLTIEPEELETELAKIAEQNKMELEEVKKKINFEQVVYQLIQKKVIDLLRNKAVLK